jgi:hypothetical protein
MPSSAPGASGIYRYTCVARPAYSRARSRLVDVNALAVGLLHRAGGGGERFERQHLPERAGPGCGEKRVSLLQRGALSGV